MEKELVFIDFIEDWGDTADCEQCGHWSQHTLYVWGYEDGLKQVEYNDDVSCYGGENFFGTLAEFKTWYYIDCKRKLPEDVVKVEEALKDLW